MTMNISGWKAAAVAAGILAVGYGAGRMSTPAKLVERDRVVSVDRVSEASSHAYVGQTEKKVEVKTNWRTVTRWEPGGAVTQTTEVASAKDEKASTSVAESDVKVKEVVKYRDVEHTKMVEGKKPDWILTAQVGSRLDGWRPVYGGAVDRRILGSVYAGAWAQASGASLSEASAGVGIKIVF